MATVTTVTLFDSLDERISTGVETVTFFHPLTGAMLEIELGEANRKHFANHIAKLDKYVAAAVEVVVEVLVAKPKAGAKNSETTKIREWARANGFTIGDRGRIKADILAAYTAAHEVIETAKEDAPAEQFEGRELRSGEPESAVEVIEIITQGDEIDKPLNETELSDEDILAMMAEIESETAEPVSFEQLAGKVDESTTNE